MPFQNGRNDCPDPSTLARFAIGEAGEFREAVARHLADCGPCCEKIGRQREAVEAAGRDLASDAERTLAWAALREAIAPREIPARPVRRFRTLWRVGVAAGALVSVCAAWPHRRSEGVSPTAGCAGPGVFSLPRKAADRSGPSQARGAAGRFEIIDLASPALDDPASVSIALSNGGVPPLVWPSVPKGTRSLALVCEELGGRPGRPPVLRWALANLPPDLRQMNDAAGDALRETSAASGRGGIQAIVRKEETGSLPGVPRRFRFTLYALDERLALPGGARPDRQWDALEHETQGPHVLGVGTMSVEVDLPAEDAGQREGEQ